MFFLGEFNKIASVFILDVIICDEFTFVFVRFEMIIEPFELLYSGGKLSIFVSSLGDMLGVSELEDVTVGVISDEIFNSLDDVHSLDLLAFWVWSVVCLCLMVFMTVVSVMTLALRIVFFFRISWIFEYRSGRGLSASYSYISWCKLENLNAEIILEGVRVSERA